MAHPGARLAAVGLALLLVASAGGRSDANDAQDIPGGLEGGVDWINTSGPIHLRDLRGKIVLLDFWTYCCINCHHILPDLEYLEKKYPNELVVIGVHTAKFDAEKETDNIRKKVAEYRIKHPVVNDANQILWNRFGVTSWPTLVLINAQGRYVASASGEGHREGLDRVIGQLVAEHKERNELNLEPIKFFPENEKPHKGPLLYPGKITADADGNRLFITDTGHNRIVVTDLDGKHLATIGSGMAGWNDGSFEKATFNRPQGTCLLGGKLYVADTESHSIREVDLDAKTVRTVAGTGEQGYEHNVAEPIQKATATPLSSPWDVVPVNERTLAVALAGLHQLWLLDLENETVVPWVGSGREDVRDGLIGRSPFHALRPESKPKPYFADTETAMAQPSGLAASRNFLFIADSEGSAVRAINLNPDHFGGGSKKGQFLDTIAGTHDLPMGQSLFQFGDRDGKQNESLLQHCLGVAYADGTVYVADSYNNKIKALDVGTRVLKTLAGVRNPGSTDSPPQFDEPGGLSVAGSSLYVADTNNHSIRVVDRATGKVRTLTLSGVDPPAPVKSKYKFDDAKVIKLAETKVAPVNQFALAVDLTLPEGFGINPEAEMPALLESTDAPELLGRAIAREGFKISPPRTQFEVDVPLATTPKAGDTLKLKFSLSVFECEKRDDELGGVCRVRNFVWQVPVVFANDGARRVTLTNRSAASE